MTKHNQDFEIIQGETKTVTIPTTNGAGVAQSLTGGSVVWYLKTLPGLATVLTKTSGAGQITLTTTTATNDTVNVALAPADTATLASAVYYHECIITDASTNISVLATGTVAVIGV